MGGGYDILIPNLPVDWTQVAAPPPCSDFLYTLMQAPPLVPSLMDLTLPHFGGEAESVVNELMVLQPLLQPMILNLPYLPSGASPFIPGGSG